MIPTLYRSLLKQARHFDRSGPSLTSLVHRSDVPSPSQYPETESNHDASVAKTYNNHLTQYLGSSSAVLLSPTSSSNLFVASVVRSGFRNVSDVEVAIDCGFLALRELGNKARWGELLGVKQGPPGGGHEASTPPPSRSAWSGSPLPTCTPPTPGTFLLSHPLLGDYFSRSVVLVTSVTPDGDVEGYIVNEPEQLGRFKVDVEYALKVGGIEGNGRWGDRVKVGGPQPVSAYDPLSNIKALSRGSLCFLGGE